MVKSHPSENFEIRLLPESDPEIISAAFTKIGWNKPSAQYEQYFAEQKVGSHSVLIATISAPIRGSKTGHLPQNVIHQLAQGMGAFFADGLDCFRLFGAEVNAAQEQFDI